MIPCKNAATAVAGRTARACDNCIRRQARWFCAADDAFLCPTCDASVHSANTLARRHHRVRLKAAPCINSIPAWHQGFTRKPRTPRQGKLLRSAPNLEELVPDLGADDTTSNENEVEQLLYRVPSIDPSFANNDSYYEAEAEWNRNGGHKASSFLGSGADFTEFAADVEVLLGKGLEDESFGMGEMGFSVFNAREENDSRLISPKVEDEEPEHCKLGVEDCGPKRVQLKLDYAAVIVAWEGQGSPWLNGGDRPVIDPERCLISEVEKMGGSGKMAGVGGDGAREARVSRYREKRRTRLFAKKIRYEVRKLNAEKRPRMKGRFVKRASFLGPNAAAAGARPGAAAFTSFG